MYTKLVLKFAKKAHDINPYNVVLAQGTYRPQITVLKVQSYTFGGNNSKMVTKPNLWTIHNLFGRGPNLYSCLCWNILGL